VICLTFDTDWMTDATLARFLHEFPLPGRATFFCHDAFACLVGGEHELAPHPFINDLRDWQPALTQLTERVSPGARGVRAHSCVFSHAVAVGLRGLKFEYVSQANGMFRDGIKPFRHPWGVWELPIYYMDNMDFWVDANWPSLGHLPFNHAWIDQAIRGSALYVMDFHPVHIALNTRTPADYAQVKSRIVDGGASPFDLAFPGRGTREYFCQLCDAMNGAGIRSISCGEAVDHWAASLLEVS
jgi:hypothetical protein